MTGDWRQVDGPNPLEPDADTAPGRFDPRPAAAVHARRDPTIDQVEATRRAVLAPNPEPPDCEDTTMITDQDTQRFHDTFATRPGWVRHTPVSDRYIYTESFAADGPVDLRVVNDVLGGYPLTATLEVDMVAGELVKTMSIHPPRVHALGISGRPTAHRVDATSDDDIAKTLSAYEWMARDVSLMSALTNVLCRSEFAEEEDA